MARRLHRLWRYPVQKNPILSAPELIMQVASTSAPVTASLGSSNAASGSGSDPLMDVAPSGNNSDDLMRFLKMTPAQKMEYEWLNSHHVTQQDLKGMSSDQRDAIRQQMAADLKQKAQQDMEAKAAKANGGVNIVV